MQGLAVEERPLLVDPDVTGSQCKKFTISLQFYPLESYPKGAHIKWEELQNAVEGQFAARMDILIVNELRKASYTPAIEVRTIPHANTVHLMKHFSMYQTSVMYQ